MSKFKRNGELDRRFGDRGRTDKVVIGARVDDWDMFAPVLWPDGRVSVLATLRPDNPHNRYTGIAIATFNKRGKLDKAFARDGVFTRRMHKRKGLLSAKSMLAVADDRLVLCGVRRPTGSSRRFATLMAITNRGRFDTKFGAASNLTLPTTFGASCERIAAQSTGAIVTVSSTGVNVSGPTLTVHRANRDGVLDAGFGSAGRTELQIAQGTFVEMTDLQRDRRNRMLLAYAAYGTGYGDFAGHLIRLTAAGVADSSFGSAGDARISAIDGFNVEAQRNGSTLLFGYALRPPPWKYDPDEAEVSRPAVGRLMDSGALDRTWNSRGYRVFSKLGGEMTTHLRIGRHDLFGPVERLPRSGVPGRSQPSRVLALTLK